MSNDTGRDGAAAPVPVPQRSGTGVPAQLYWEDLLPGQVHDLGVTEVDREEMLAFARRYDPQWYHVDPQQAADSSFGGVIASGFFTVSLFMRAYVDGLLSRAAADASPGLEELRWLAPVYPGDRLAVTVEVVDRTRSGSRPGCGTVSLRGTMTCTDGVQDRTRGRMVLRTRFRGWFRRRDGDAETG